nr:MAG TPA: hypothetical protein [Caudoviricetes sp.]
MIGKRFGRLTVINRCNERAKNGTIKYICQCDCGNVSIIRGDHLRIGDTLSCGCLIKKYAMSKYVKKGQSVLDKRLYRIYDKMKQRCYNSNSVNYKYYGERGIKVCDEWLNDFMTFYNWSMENGYNNTLTIDRIDVNGNYEPSNCKWSTYEQQNSNTRRNIYLTYNGHTLTISQWARKLNIPLSCIYYRYHNGYSDKGCLFGKRFKNED